MSENSKLNQGGGGGGGEDYKFEICSQWHNLMMKYGISIKDNSVSSCMKNGKMESNTKMQKTREYIKREGGKEVRNQS